jgi:hypothetical protein
VVIGTMAGYVLTVCLVACVTFVLAAIADVAREHEQGARPRVSVSYAGTELPAYYPAPGAKSAKYIGRHRR